MHEIVHQIEAVLDILQVCTQLRLCLNQFCEFLCLGYCDADPLSWSAAVLCRRRRRGITSRSLRTHTATRRSSSSRYVLIVLDRCNCTQVYYLSCLPTPLASAHQACTLCVWWPCEQDNAQSRPHELEEALKAFDTPKARIPVRLMNRAMFEEEVWLEDEYLDGAQGEWLLKAALWRQGGGSRATDVAHRRGRDCGRFSVSEASVLTLQCCVVMWFTGVMDARRDMKAKSRQSIRAEQKKQAKLQASKAPQAH